MRVWRPCVETRTLLRPHGIERTPTFHGNTVEHVIATGRPYRMRLDEGRSLDLPILGELRDMGLTDYLIVPLPAGSGRTGAASWATARPASFTASEIAALIAFAYGQPLLATGAFTDGLTPIDTVTLRGFNERQTLFVLRDD